MQIQLQSRPAGTIAKLMLNERESVTVQVGAMIAMSEAITVETSSQQRGGTGGLVKGLKRMFAGENFFLNHFTAHDDKQMLMIGPGLLGDIVHHTLSAETLIVQGSSWLASGPRIDIDATWQGFGKGLFSGESMFWVKCSGEGDVLLNSFGAIYTVDVDGDYVVDTGHIVAFQDTLQFRIGKAGQSLLGSLLGGEGLVCKFNGKGKLYCQTHNPPSFGRLLGPKLRPRRQ